VLLARRPSVFRCGILASPTPRVWKLYTQAGRGLRSATMEAIAKSHTMESLMSLSSDIRKDVARRGATGKETLYLLARRA
jgi:hypothetical protein